MTLGDYIFDSVQEAIKAQGSESEEEFKDRMKEILEHVEEESEEFGEEAQKILDQADEQDGLTLLHQIDGLQGRIDQVIYTSYKEDDPDPSP